MGWVSQVRAFAGNRWEVFLLFAGLFVVLVSAAAVLVRRRDLGMGLIKPAKVGQSAAAPARGVRAGVADAARAAHRLGSGLRGVRVILASLATAFDELIGDNEQAKQIIERMGGTGQLSVLYVAAICPSSA